MQRSPALRQPSSDYIRFEEQILFETAQRVLDEATLAALAEPSAWEARPRCTPARRLRHPHSSVTDDPD